MTDLSDLRRRAAQQAAYGNYWAGKALGLCDRLAEAEAALALAHRALDDIASGTFVAEHDTSRIGRVGGSDRHRPAQPPDPHGGTMTPTETTIEPMPADEAVRYLAGTLPADPAYHRDDERTRALLGLQGLADAMEGRRLVVARVAKQLRAVEQANQSARPHELAGFAERLESIA